MIGLKKDAVLKIKVKILHESFCYHYIANVSINRRLLANFEEKLQVQHQTSSFYSPIASSSGRK